MPTYIEDLLLSRGVRPTPQRAVITEFLVGTTSHPTADEVYQAVFNKLPVPLSRATVYNTLNCLAEAKVIKEVFTEPGRSRYDANVTDHHHFVDVKSGQVMDIQPEQFANLALNLGSKFRIHGFHVTVYGEVKKD